MHHVCISVLLLSNNVLGANGGTQFFKSTLYRVVPFCSKCTRPLTFEFFFLIFANLIRSGKPALRNPKS
jgi:hypothetical protein